MDWMQTVGLARRSVVSALALSSWLAVSTTAFPATECVWIEVVGGEGGKDEIVVTYPSPVGPSQATRDFRQLANEGGWTYSPPVEAGPSDVLHGCATFRCVCDGAIQSGRGSLPWEVFCFVFRRYDAVHLTFLPRDPFYYKGPTGRWRNDLVSATFVSVPSEHSYGIYVEMMGRSATRPAELSRGLVSEDESATPPEAVAAGAAAARPERSGRPAVVWVALVLCAVLAAGSLTMVTMALVRRRHQR